MMEENEIEGLKQIKNYVLLKKIDEGFCSQIYLGKDTKDKNADKLVAIKTIPCSYLINNETRQLLYENECKIMSTLNHKNIIKYIGVEKTNNNVYIITEYCNGKTLSSYKKLYMYKYKKRVPEEIIQKITRQIIEGLNYLSKKNIIHRDLKSDNILINFDDISNSVNKKDKVKPIDFLNFDLENNYNFTVKIADFGFASNNVENINNEICGTPVMMSPEALGIGKGNLSYKSDLWSLGVMIYELFYDTYPFKSSTYDMLKEKVKQGIYYFYDDQYEVSYEAIQFIIGLLEFEQEKRMDWDEINKSEFISGDTKRFRYIISKNAIEANCNDSNRVRNYIDEKVRLFSDFKLKNFNVDNEGQIFKKDSKDSNLKNSKGKKDNNNQVGTKQSTFNSGDNEYNHKNNRLGDKEENDKMKDIYKTYNFKSSNFGVDTHNEVIVKKNK